MAWGGFILTNAGRNLLAKVQAGTIEVLNITRFGIGDGTYAGSYSTITNLVSQKQSVALRTKNAKDQFTNIDGYFSNEGLAEGFYFREWGIFAMDGLQEILYAYDNAGTDAEYIAPDGGVRYEKMLKAALSISADANVTINTSGVIYATIDDIVSNIELHDSNEEAHPDIREKIGDITNLITDNKTDLVAAVNEVRTQNNNLAEDVNELFQSVSDGKTLVAGAITDKGVNTSPTDTFQTMADNIDSIVTDPSIDTTDATAADVLAPKKVVSQGQLIIGTIPVAPTFPNENEAEDTHFYGTDFTSSSKGNNLFMKVPKGYYNGGWLGARVNNLIPSNVKAGIVLAPRLGAGKNLTGTFTSDATAAAAQILSGAIAYVNGNKIIGTMVNRGAVNQNLTTEGQEYTISSGYHNGLGKVKAVITGLVASVIKAGTTVGGVAGNFTADATATATQMLSGAIAYVKGNKVIGTILSKTAQTYTPSTVNQIIAANQYLSGVQTILGSPNFVEGNIKDGVNMWGKVGVLKEAIVFDANKLIASRNNNSSISGVSFSETQTNKFFFTFRNPRNRYIYIGGTGKIIVKSTSEIFNNHFGISYKSPIEIQLPFEIPSSDQTSNIDDFIVLNQDRVMLTLSSYSESKYSYIE